MAKDDDTDPLADALDDRDVNPPEDDDDDGPDDGNNPEETDPAVLRAELAEAKKALTRARNQAKRLRESKGKATDKNGVTGPAEADKDAAQWQVRAAKSEAKSALLAAGADPSLVSLAAGRLRAEDIEYDDDNEPILEDWVDDMRERYPALFRTGGYAEDAAPARRAPSANQGRGAASRPAPVKLSHGQKMMAAAKAAQGVRPRRRP